MSKTGVLLSLVFIAVPALANQQKPPASCKTKFTVVREDALQNVTQGLPPKDVEWFQKKIQKKYPEVCYAAPGPDVPLVFYLTLTPDTYHGTRVVTQSQESPVTGTVTDTNGNTSQVSGTTTTTSSTAVPYTVNYFIFTLSVETLQPDGKWQVRHRFSQRGLYNTYAGIPLGGRGHHPVHALVEDAAKWIQAGGLSDPLQAVAPQ